MTSYVTRAEFERMSERLSQLEKLNVVSSPGPAVHVVTVTSEAGDIHIKEIVRRSIDEARISARRGDFGSRAYDSLRG